MCSHKPQFHAGVRTMREARPIQLAPAPTLSDEIPLHRAQNLTQGGSVAHIDLAGQTYVLRITRAGKLILTK
jgi:hemin uptake protein HemP